MEKLNGLRTLTNKVIWTLLASCGFCSANGQSLENNDGSDESEIRPAYGTAVANYENREEFQCENPVGDYLKATFPAGKAEISIFSVSGKLQKQAVIKSDENLYVGDLKPDNYIVTIQSGEKKYSGVILKE